MRRREFIALSPQLGTWPLGAHAQQAAIPVIGSINPASARSYTPQVTAFLRGWSKPVGR